MYRISFKNIGRDNKCFEVETEDPNEEFLYNTVSSYLLSRGLYFTGISEGETGRILCGVGCVGEYSFKII